LLKNWDWDWDWDWDWVWGLKTTVGFHKLEMLALVVVVKEDDDDVDDEGCRVGFGNSLV